MGWGSPCWKAMLACPHRRDNGYGGTYQSLAVQCRRRCGSSAVLLLSWPGTFSVADAAAPVPLVPAAASSFPPLLIPRIQAAEIPYDQSLDEQDGQSRYDRRARAPGQPARAGSRHHLQHPPGDRAPADPPPILFCLFSPPPPQQQEEGDVIRRGGELRLGRTWMELGIPGIPAEDGPVLADHLPSQPITYLARIFIALVQLGRM